MKAPWYDGRLCAFDLETTAPDPLEARIVTGCVAHVGGGYTTEKQTWLVDPCVEIPAEATAIHHITTEYAQKSGVQPVVALPQIASALQGAWERGEPVVAFNACYDLTVIDRELRRYGFPPLQVGPVVDPFVIDKHVDRFRKGKRTLTATCQHYNALLEGAHDSSFDAIAAARLAWRLAKTVPEIGRLELAELHEAQARWYAEQAAGLEEYFRKQGKNETCNREWPMRRAA